VLLRNTVLASYFVAGLPPVPAGSQIRRCIMC